MPKDRDFLKAFSGEDRMTAAQIADKLEQCARQNRMTHTMFLTPHQRAVAQQVVVCCGEPPHRIMGGHPEAERCVMLFLPDYMDAESIPEEELPFGAIRAEWGHGAVLSHRDILGSLMAQGIRREVLGDILVAENGCDVIALRECIPFLRDNWLSAGRTGLHPVEISLSGLRIPAADGRELVLYNVHLSAYTSDGTIAVEQLELLRADMQAEYEKGNWCIAGGDFNKDLLGQSEEIFGGSAEGYTWAQPLPEGIWDGTNLSLVAPLDETNPVPSCRNADAPYHEGQYVLTVDGFVVSDNVTVEQAVVEDTGFAWSDHNPVSMRFVLN